MEGGGVMNNGGNMTEGAAAAPPLMEVVEGLETPPIQLTKALNISDMCSETGSVFEISRDECQEKGQPFERTFFDDDTVINSLRLGPGNCVFSDEDEQSNPDDDDLEPFEKLAQKMEDMTGDGGVLKMEVRSGIGGDIPEGASVTFHYTAYLQYSDEPFDSSHFRNKPERKVIDGGELMPGLNAAVKTMRKGELARFLVAPKYAFGKLGCLPRIPGNETILYEVEIMSFVDRAAADAFEDLDYQAQSSATFKEKIEAARGYHRQGNEQYREDSLSSARSSYFRASWILENIRLKDQSEEEQRGTLLGKLRCNLAQVFLELKEPARACTQCRLGLGVSRGLTTDILTKLHYRLGKARMMLNDFKGARKEFLTAQRLKPNNPDISKELLSLLHQEEKYTAKERFMCQRMFSTTPNTQAPNQNSTTTNQPTTPTISEDFQHVVEERVLSFKYDANVSELPFPSGLSEEEVAFIAAVGRAAQLSVHFSHKGFNTSIKLIKK